MQGYNLHFFCIFQFGVREVCEVIEARCPISSTITIVLCIKNDKNDSAHSPGRMTVRTIPEE